MQTIYCDRSEIPFSVSEWDKIKSFANFQHRQHGAEIEDRSNGLDEIHLVSRSDDCEHWTESFCLYQAIEYTEDDREKQYSFSFTKTYSIEPFESTIIEILKYARYIAPWVILKIESDEEVIR